MTRHVLPTLVLACVSLVDAAAQCPPAEPGRLEVKYVRDSAEYGTLTRQVYRQAAGAVVAARAGLPAGRPWAVVIDVDETALDNSVYELERTAYGLRFEDESWNAWVRRREAPAVPGAAEFVRAVRTSGGRVAWISNRDEITREATRQNLVAVGLWEDGDRLCLATEAGYSKAVRRREVAAGEGACAWSGTPTAIVVYVGDQMGDFPAVGEDAPAAGSDEAFGTRFFLLPNPMYGAWARAVTR
jgi:5'-nucleotidase (lipoprotein e(P4) family)